MKRVCSLQEECGHPHYPHYPHFEVPEGVLNFNMLVVPSKNVCHLLFKNSRTFSSATGMAKAGPMPMSLGSTPTWGPKSALLLVGRLVGHKPLNHSLVQPKPKKSVRLQVKHKWISGQRIQRIMKCNLHFAIQPMTIPNILNLHDPTGPTGLDCSPSSTGEATETRHNRQTQLLRGRAPAWRLWPPNHNTQRDQLFHVINLFLKQQMGFRDWSSHMIFNHFNPAWPGEPWQLHRLLDCCFLRWCCHQPWRPQRPKPSCWTLQMAHIWAIDFEGKKTKCFYFAPCLNIVVFQATNPSLFTSERGHVFVEGTGFNLPKLSAVTPARGPSSAVTTVLFIVPSWEKRRPAMWALSLGQRVRFKDIQTTATYFVCIAV